MAEDLPIEWWSPRRHGAERVSVRDHGVQFSSALVEGLTARGWDFVRIGLSGKCIIVMKGDSTSGVRLQRSGKWKGRRIESKALVRWLTARGIQEGWYEARWEERAGETVVILYYERGMAR